MTYAGGGGRTNQGFRAGYYGSASAEPNSGSGGAGTTGNGGSGIVIIKYNLTAITSVQPANITADTSSNPYTISYNFTANQAVTWSISPTTYGDISSNGELTLTFPTGTLASGTFTITATSTTGTATQSWTYNVQTYTQSLRDKLSISNQSQIQCAFSIRLLNSLYTGAVINIRRSSDNVTSDFYGSTDGLTLKTSGNISYTTWIGASTGYVVTWYDQSGLGRHATQTNTSYQPVLDFTSKWITFNGSNQFMDLPSMSYLNGSAYTYSMVTKRTSTKNSNIIIGGLAVSTNTNLHIGWVNGVSGLWRTAHYNNDADFAVTGLLPSNVELITGTYTLNGNREVWVNGASLSRLSSGSTGALSSIGTQYIGKFYTSQWYQGNISEIIMFNAASTSIDREILEQDTMSFYNITPSIKLYPSAAWAILEASAITQSNNTAVGAWGVVRSFTQATELSRPTYFASGGFNNGAYVFFNRTNSTFLNAATQSFYISDNGGFTAMCLIKYTGAAADWERIFDFGSGSGGDNILLTRYATTQNFEGNVHNSSVMSNVVTTNNPIVQEEWFVVAYRYVKQSNLQIYKNNVLQTNATTSTDFINRTVTNTYIGKANWNNAYLNAHISKLFIYDRALTDTEMTTLYNYMI
jgi:hypothetical protein